MRTKKFSKTASMYAEKLRKLGYTVRFNWVDDNHYEDVSVCGAKFRGYGGEFSTPRKAYQYINNQ